MRFSDKIGEELKAQRFQMLQDIAEELSGEVNFPTSFNVIVNLREKLNDPEWALDAVASALSTEPLVASRLVAMANSAAYNTGGPEIMDVKRAVMRLGINLVRTTALMVVTSQIKNAMSLSVFSDLSQKLWEHSLRTASSAYVISKHYSNYNADEAMLAGMVHDIGAFYMLYRASQYEELCERPDTVKYIIMQWHESIGYSLLEALGLPEAITGAIREHDHPHPLPPKIRNLSDIVYVANLLSGGTKEWDYMENGKHDELLDSLENRFADLVEEIDQHETGLKAIFT